MIIDGSQGGASGSSSGINIENADYVVLEGLTIQNYQERALKYDYSDFGEIRNVLVENGVHRAIALSYSDHIIIDNLTARNNSGSAILVIAGGGGGGGGGGGCSVSAGGEGNIVEFIFPYIGFAVVMAILKVRDARYRKARNMKIGNVKDGLSILLCEAALRYEVRVRPAKYC